MNRNDFLKTIFLAGLSTVTMKLKALDKLLPQDVETDTMPLLFVGHGNPMNAIEDNDFSRGMKKAAAEIPQPKTVLVISAHWETRGTFVTAMEKPRTIHDFGGFPQALFDVQYPAPGSPELAQETKNMVKKTSVELDKTWGLDHGCWSVTKNMFPAADIPIVQMSLDYTAAPRYHYELAKELSALRKKGVLILGSGNMVHNLHEVSVRGNDFNAPYAYAWAEEANEIFKKNILSGNHNPLINYSSLGKAVAMAIPTPEHYLPLLYILGLKEENETIRLFNDVTVGGSVSMTSFSVKPS